MQPQTNNPTPSSDPDSRPNPPQTATPPIEPANTPLPMPTIGGPTSNPAPVEQPVLPPKPTSPVLETQPTPSIQSISPQPPAATVPAQTQPTMQPVITPSSTVSPATFIPQVIAPASLTSTASTTPVNPVLADTPSVVGANLPGSPDSGTMFVGGDGGMQTVAATGNTKLHYASPSRKKLAIGGGVAAGVTTLAALFLFVIYIPNTPTNVMKTGMSRTGKQMTALVETLSDPKTAAELEKTKLTVKGSLDINGKVSTININTNGDDTKTDTAAKVNINVADVPEMNLTADVKTQLPEGATFPNVYFRVGGFSSLGYDAFLPGINSYDNKWISVEQDYLKQFEESLASTSGEGDSAKNMTQEDVMSIVKDINTVSQEYIFTTEPEKAVIKVGEFIATEDSEGITANHYKASIDKDNLKKYCVALGTKLLGNKVVKDNKLLGETDAAEIKENCKTAGNDIKADDSFDIWIDKKYKLFHKVRFYEDLKGQAKKYEQEKEECLAEFQQDPDPQGLATDSYCSYNDDMIVTGEAYTEFGQIYKGDDTFFLFAGQMTDTDKQKSKLRLEMTVDVKKLTFDGKVIVSTKSEGTNVKGEMTMKTEPFSGEVDAAKPDGAVPIQQVIDELTAAQPAEPDYYQMGAGVPILQPVTSQLNQWSNWLR